MKVFISHSSHDAATATQVGNGLADCGFDVWMAQTHIGPGANYAAEIVRAISGVDCLLLILTEDALRSEHVKREVNLALSANCKLLPITFTTANEHNALALDGEWAYWLGVVQIHKASGPEDAVQAARRALGDAQPSETTPPEPRRRATPTPSARQEAQIRSALIQTAAASGTLQMAIERAKKQGATREEVVAVAERLREGNLLRFEGDLDPVTVIRLN